MAATLAAPHTRACATQMYSIQLQATSARIQAGNEPPVVAVKLYGSIDGFPGWIIQFLNIWDGRSLILRQIAMKQPDEASLKVVSELSVPAVTLYKRICVWAHVCRGTLFLLSTMFSTEMSAWTGEWTSVSITCLADATQPDGGLYIYRTEIPQKNFRLPY